MSHVDPAPGAVSPQSDEVPLAVGSAGNGDRGAAAQGPIPEPVPAAGESAPTPRTDSPAEAAGRLILSTAFVRVGPDGLLTVTRHDEQELALRDVALNARDYCGTRVIAGRAGKRYCGGYAEIAAARPGGAATPGQPDLAASHPLKPSRD